MDAHLRAGIAIYNAGRFHAAHDAWEERWLALEPGTHDERLLHGLIQFTAAIHHATEHNRAGATGLAESAREYLAGVSETYRDVNVGAVCAYLAAVGDDPEAIEREPPLELTHEGQPLALADLEFPASAVAAPALAEADGYDETTIERAVAYARDDVEAGVETSPFVALVLDFVREPEHRPIAYRRLREHTERREHRDRGVEGLFEER